MSDDLMKRALIVIEGILLETPEVWEKDQTPDQKKLAKIYRIAHAATSSCEHREWAAEIISEEERLKFNGVI